MWVDDGELSVTWVVSLRCESGRTCCAARRSRLGVPDKSNGKSECTDEDENIGIVEKEIDGRKKRDAEKRSIRRKGEKNTTTVKREINRIKGR